MRIPPFNIEAVLGPHYTTNVDVEYGKSRIRKKILSCIKYSSVLFWFALRIGIKSWTRV